MRAAREQSDLLMDSQNLSGGSAALADVYAGKPQRNSAAAFSYNNTVDDARARGIHPRSAVRRRFIVGIKRFRSLLPT